MKRTISISMFIIVGLFFSIQSAFAGPPKKDRCQWIKVDAGAMESQSSTAIRVSHDPGEEITVPEAWFGGWGALMVGMRLPFT